MNTATPVIDAGTGYFEPGDTVMLTSLGPDMTVVGVCPDCGEVEVAWFMFHDEGECEYFRETFPAAALELAA